MIAKLSQKIRARKTLLLGILVAILLWLGILAGQFLVVPMLPYGAPAQTLLFADGASARSLAAELDARQLWAYPNLLVALIELSGNERSLHAGEYEISHKTSAFGLVHKIVTGDAITHAFTLVEGWTFADALSALAHNQYLVHKIATNETPESVMTKLGHQGVEPEGRFAPDTYVFSGRVSDVAVLSGAYNLQEKRLQIAWQNKDTAANYPCQFDALIVASLVEKESANVQDRRLIAGVIQKRLELGMPLGIDAAVIYGLGKRYTGKLSTADLQIDTMYNTYTHKGLPPTPIAMPSQDAINAALHPVVGNALYYISRSDGTSVFSATLQEHNQAIQKYLR